jgi:hypothetical protein
MSIRSWQSCIVTRRLACDPRLQNALYHEARVALILSEIGRDMSRFPTAGHLEWRKSRAVGPHCADTAVGA